MSSDRRFGPEAAEAAFLIIQHTDDVRLRLDSIADPEAVDSLRAALGMPPLDDYLTVVEKMYGTEVER